MLYLPCVRKTRARLQQAGAVRSRSDQRKATSDWMELEKQRGISITSTVLSFEYNGNHINLLDTPGHQVQILVAEHGSIASTRLELPASPKLQHCTFSYRVFSGSSPRPMHQIGSHSCSVKKSGESLQVATYRHTQLRWIALAACRTLVALCCSQDFSEDTYRTLAAADNAVMLVDAAKGLEPQTRKLFEVRWSFRSR